MPIGFFVKIRKVGCMSATPIVSAHANDALHADVCTSSNTPNGPPDGTTTNGGYAPSRWPHGWASRHAATTTGPATSRNVVRRSQAGHASTRGIQACTWNAPSCGHASARVDATTTAGHGSSSWVNVSQYHVVREPPIACLLPRMLCHRSHYSHQPLFTGLMVELAWRTRLGRAEVERVYEIGACRLSARLDASRN